MSTSPLVLIFPVYLSRLLILDLPSGTRELRLVLRSESSELQGNCPVFCLIRLNKPTTQTRRLFYKNQILKQLSFWLLLLFNTFSDRKWMDWFRYLAPEYVDVGKITRKVDVYAFGVVLLELLTGKRSTELQLYEMQTFSPGRSSHFTPFGSAESKADYFTILDPHLTATQSINFEHQVEAMVHAASLCLLRDPESRPPMSKVLQIFHFIVSPVEYPRSQIKKAVSVWSSGSQNTRKRRLCHPSGVGSKPCWQPERPLERS